MEEEDWEKGDSQRMSVTYKVIVSPYIQLEAAVARYKLKVKALHHLMTDKVLRNIFVKQLFCSLKKSKLWLSFIRIIYGDSAVTNQILQAGARCATERASYFRGGGISLSDSLHQ